MMKLCITLLLCIGNHLLLADQALDEDIALSADENASKESEVGAKTAFVIPIRDQIGPPILDVLRRGMKHAINSEMDLVILDMDTPGGELGVTLEIMEEILDSLDHWEGEVITYVNKEAISAGAYIAIATQEIAFAPFSQIGAAEAVSGGGGEIDPSMKRKINSYLKAKIRNFSGPHKYRSQVMAAMMDGNASLVIEGEPLLASDGSLIKNPGELLTLTGEEAVKVYGSPPQPLLGIGVFEKLEDLLAHKWGEGNHQIVRMEINWAEQAGLWLNGIAPVLLSVGLVLLFIEFKTPGFGIFGSLGIGFILIFFGSKYVAGLAGQEELLLFLLGVVLVLLEIFLAPGLFFPAMLGLVLMFGSLVWAMVDVWPGRTIEWSIETFRVPLVEITQALGLALLIGYLTMKLLGKTSLGQAMLLEEAVMNPSGKTRWEKIEPGAFGVCLTELYPVGKVEICGGLFDARSTMGKIDRGDRVQVVGKSGFELIVEKKDSDHA